MQLEDDELDDLMSEDGLKFVKNSVRDWEDCFKENVERYITSKKFLLVSTVNDSDASLLNDMNRPPMEFNQLDAIGCKLMGEFSSQEPGIVVAASDGIIVDDEIAMTVECVEAHMRHDLAHTNNGNANNKVFKDTVYGGYGCFEVYTEYASKSSFEQVAPYRRVNPTICGWDPMAIETHKGDGKYCYTKVYMTHERVMLNFGKQIADSLSYNSSGDFGDSVFQWSYQSGRKKIAVIVFFYYKHERRGKLLLLSNGESMDEKKYKAQMKEWDELSILPPPPTIQDSREQIFTDIVRYTVCENKVIKREETDFEMLPLVFVDGNSAEAQGEKGGGIRQVTRSYFYNAFDSQRFKDFAGQTFAGELQATMQSPIIAAEESIPDQYLDNYLTPSRASVLIYRSRYKDQPDQPLPPPQIINRPEVPQYIPAAFYGADKLIQTTLGNYDTQLAMQPQVSGVALQEGSMDSDAAAKPYVDSLFEGIDRVAQIKLNLIPKLYKTPRSIPITLKNGKKSYAIVNTEDYAPSQNQAQNGQPQQPPKMEQDPDAVQNHAVYMNYDPDSLLVQVKAGPNSETQKRDAVDQMIKLMNISPQWNGLMSGPGMELMADNLDFRGAERLKAMVGPYQQQQQEQQGQQQNMMMQMQQQMQGLQMQLLQSQANKNNSEAHKNAGELVLDNKKIDNEEAMNVANLLLEREDKEKEFELKTESLAIEQQKVDNEALLSRQELNQGQVDQILKASEIDAERARTKSQYMLEVSKHIHKVNLDLNALSKQGSSKENDSID